MTLALYMDEQVPSAITDGLRQRSVDVLTVQEDGRRGVPDDVVLDRAGGLGRVLFTRDDDFLSEAARRQIIGEWFVGVIYAHQLRVPVGRCVTELELLAGVLDASEMANRVEHLPLK